MSSPSEDRFIAELERASNSMQAVRQAQAQSDRKLSGKHHLTPEQTQAITQAADASSLVAAVKDAAKVDLPLHNLFERYEEMCRRHKYSVDAELRPAVQKLLAAELWVNQQALHTRAEKLIPATVHHGAFAPALFQQFPAFAKIPHAYTQASIYAPARLHDFLKEASENVATLSVDPEFAHFQKTRSVFVVAAINYSSDPRGFLRVAGRPRGGKSWQAMLLPPVEDGRIRPQSDNAPARR